MEQYLRQLVEIEFEDKKQIFTGFLIDYSDDWIFFETIQLILFWMVL